MAVPIQIISKLERQCTLAIPRIEVESEVEKLLKARARTVKMQGFRPGKVPFKIIAAQYGAQLENEILNQKVGEALSHAAQENNLKIAGSLKINPKPNENVADDALLFDAVFEIYPEVKVGDITALQVERMQAEVTEEAVDKTLEVLRKQRTHFHAKDKADALVEAGDKVTIDFVGRLDGAEFNGGKAEGFQFVVGEGQMLQEFEQAVLGLQRGASKVFPLTFPPDYHGKEVAGKTVEFTIKLQNIEYPHLPELDASFAKSLGVEDGDLTQLRKDIEQNLQREVAARIKEKNKARVMDALLTVCEFDVPKALIARDIEDLTQMARQNLKKQGSGSLDNLTLPPALFQEQAERRVKLGLLIGELVRRHDLKVSDIQLRQKVEAFAQNYEDAQQVIDWHFADRRNLQQIEAAVLEENVMQYVLDHAKVTDKPIAFEELMEMKSESIG